MKADLGWRSRWLRVAVHSDHDNVRSPAFSGRTEFVDAARAARFRCQKKFRKTFDSNRTSLPSIMSDSAARVDR